MNKSDTEKSKKTYPTNQHKSELEFSDVLCRYLTKLWKIKTLRADFFDKEIRDILALIKSEYHSDLRKEIIFILGFAAKINIQIMSSDAYLIDRPNLLNQELRRLGR